jgi:IS30 family transposase
LPKRFESTQVEAAKEHLRNLPTRDTARNLTLEHTIRSLRAEIDEALKRGNSVEDIVEALKGSSISIGVSTLKNYLRRSGRKPAGRPRRLRLTHPSSDTAPEGS